MGKSKFAGQVGGGTVDAVARSQISGVNEQLAANVSYQQMRQRPILVDGDITGMEYLNPDGSVFRREDYEFGDGYIIERVTVNGVTNSFRHNLETLEMEVL